MRLLIVGLNYAPEPVGIGPYTSGMAEALALRGWDVDVVAGQPYYPQWHRYPGFGGLWRTSIENGVSIVRCAHYVPAHPSGWRRIVHLASFAASALLPALRRALRKPDIVLCVAPALLSVPVGRLAASLAGAKLWIHLQDFEVEAAFATGLVSQDGPVSRIALGLENRLLRMADRVSTISPQMAARLLDKGINARRILEIRNWADDRFVRAGADGSAYRCEWNLGDRKVALYSGNIANKQGIEILIEAARVLTPRPDIVLLICGEGPNRSRLAELAKGLKNVQLQDLQPVERMGELLALADVHLLPQIPGAADLVLPSKLTNMLASGRPVIATAHPGSGLYEEVDGCGVVTAPGDAVALAAALAELADDPVRRTELGGAARKRALAR
ncbi:MAG: WcaI family glycosyltransferase [Croceibacterium sp.]